MVIVTPQVGQGLCVGKLIQDGHLLKIDDESRRWTGR